MRIIVFIKLGCAVVLLGGALIGAGSAHAAARQPMMATTGLTSQPVGHYEFCQSHVSECTVHTRRDPRVHLTPEKWNELVAVNANVNTTIKSETDQEIYGRPEFWAYPTTAGDCEDLVLLKRRDLIEKGWPTGALLITVVRQTNGEGHAVLTVLTDRGDLILDNLEARVLLWTDTTYEYVKRQSEHDSGQWTGIDDGRSIEVGSVTR